MALTSFYDRQETLNRGFTAQKDAVTAASFSASFCGEFLFGGICKVGHNGKKGRVSFLNRQKLTHILSTPLTISNRNPKQSVSAIRSTYLHLVKFRRVRRFCGLTTIIFVVKYLRLYFIARVFKFSVKLPRDYFYNPVNLSPRVEI